MSWQAYVRCGGPVKKPRTILLLHETGQANWCALSPLRWRPAHSRIARPSPHQHILWQRQQAVPLALLVGLGVLRLRLVLLQVAFALCEDEGQSAHGHVGALQAGHCWPACGCRRRARSIGLAAAAGRRPPG